MEPLTLRRQSIPDVLVVVRLGSVTLNDPHLSRSVAESYDRWGIWGFSVLGVPDGDYALLARLRPIVATRRRLLVADGPALVAAGLPLLPTLDHPHWTVVVSEPTAAQFAKARTSFRGPVDNPAWTGR